MKITLIFLITSLCSCVYCEYPTRYYPFKNNRPPPQYHPQRHGPMVPPQHMKKWQQPPGQFGKRPQNVGGNRPNRPIPMYGGQGHKNVKSQPQQPPQQLISQSQHRPTVVAPPVRSFYNQQQVASVKFPEKQQHYVQKEKPQFLSSQPIAVAQDYAYHIQSNSIPTHTTPIKQVGEKGPIHTIPAPNLSLKDKPIVVEEVRNNNNINNNQDIIRQHQYQVTEANEPLPKGPKAFLNSNLDVQQQQMYYISEQPQTLALQTQQHQQQQLNTQAIQSTFVQQQPQLNYQILNPQLFQTEPIYIQNQETYSQNQDAYNQNQEASDKISVEPEYHSFNYDEQAHQKAQKQQQQQQQERHLQQQQQERKQQQQQDRQQQQVQSVDPLIQTKIIQSYFDTRHDNENIVVPDARPSEKTQIKNENNEEILGGTIRFSSLPNKEAAERLAQLQNAGKINSHLMHMNPKDIIGSDSQNMNIYVPDDEEDDIEEDMERGKEDEGHNDKSFEDYSPEEDLTSSEEAMFGQRLIRRKH